MAVATQQHPSAQLTGPQGGVTGYSIKVSLVLRFAIGNIVE